MRPPVTRGPIPSCKIQRERQHSRLTRLVDLTTRTAGRYANSSGRAR